MPQNERCHKPSHYELEHRTVRSVIRAPRICIQFAASIYISRPGFDQSQNDLPLTKISLIHVIATSRIDT